MVKNPPALRETWVGSLDWEDALEKGMATHSSTLAWRTPWTEEHGVLQSTGLQRVGLDWVTKYSTYQFSSGVQSCLTLCNPMGCSTPGFPVHRQLPELTQGHIYWVGDAIQPLIFSCPLLLLPSLIPNIRVFLNESVLHIRWPKYWEFQLHHQEWLDLLAVQGTLKSLL